MKGVCSFTSESGQIVPKIRATRACGPQGPTHDHMPLEPQDISNLTRLYLPYSLILQIPHNHSLLHGRVTPPHGL